MRRLILIAILSPLIAFAEGVSNPMDKINAFIKPLQEEGVKGLDKAMEEAQLELNQYYIDAAKKAGKNVPNSEDFKKDMHESLEKHGKVLSAQSVEIDERLQGHMKKYTIEIQFFDGTKKKARFQFIQPTNDGDYKLVQSELLSY